MAGASLQETEDKNSANAQRASETSFCSHLPFKDREGSSQQERAAAAAGVSQAEVSRPTVFVLFHCKKTQIVLCKFAVSDTRYFLYRKKAVNGLDCI